MKNKELCKKCKYRGTIGSRTGEHMSICCDYAAVSEEKRSCLKMVHGDVVDRRGNDYDNCLLFEEGEQLGRARNADPMPMERKKHRRIGDG